jgi:flagella basal body P-ring formation protein FlgA
MDQTKFQLSTLLVVTWFVLFTSKSHAGQFQDPRSISMVAESYAHAEFGQSGDETLRVKSGPIDKRLSFNECDVPLSATNPSSISGTRLTVAVSCQGSSTWTVYVPVEVKRFRKVVTAAKTLKRGQKISSSDLAIVEVDVNRLRDEIFTDADEIVGSTVRRRITQNTAITSRNICFVCKGNPVTISVQSEALSVQAKGVALMDGAVGDLIKVRNKQTRKEIEAVVGQNGDVFIYL